SLWRNSCNECWPKIRHSPCSPASSLAWTVGQTRRHWRASGCAGSSSSDSTSTVVLTKLESWPHKDRLVGGADRKASRVRPASAERYRVRSVRSQEFEHAARDLGEGVQIVSRPLDQF